MAFRKRNARGGRRRRGRPGGMRKFINRQIANHFKQEWHYTTQAQQQVLATFGTKTFASLGTPLGDARDIWNCYFRAIKGTAPASIADTSLTTNETTDRFRVDSCQLNAAITNADLGKATLTVYYVTPRRDVPRINDLDLTGALQEGFSASGMTTTSLTGQGLSVTPFMSPNFCRAYKIYAKKTILMPPGSSTVISVKNKRPRSFTGTYLLPDKDLRSGNDTPMWYIGGYSKFLLITVTGQPVHDQTNRDRVSTSDCRLDVILTRSYKFSRIPHQHTKNFDVSSALGTIATEEIVSSVAVAAGEA